MSSEINKKSVLKLATSAGGRVDKRSIVRVLNSLNLFEEVSSIKPDIVEAFYWWVNDLNEHPKPCTTCGGDLKFRGFRHLYDTSDYCSVKCATPDNLAKSKMTIKERFGVEHQMYVQDVKDKVKTTFKKRYGANVQMICGIAVNC